jgi:serine-type D-Ala-D-Ala carboxypeptidase/endopeptidase (penicillin-binding protein 4)
VPDAPQPRTAAPEPPAARPARRSRRLPAIAGGVLAFAVAGALSLTAGIAAGSAEPEPESTTTPTAAPRTVPQEVGAPVRVPTCTIAPALGSEALGDVVGSVVEAAGGRIALDRDADRAVPAAGSAKLFTAVAALSQLGPSFQISTRVVDEEDGAIALVGRGDPTLSALPADRPGVYAGAPSLADLAEQVVEEYAEQHPGEQVTSISLDSTYWPLEDDWSADWDDALRTQGLLPRITALQVDGDRQDATAAISPRSEAPVEAAGAAFLAALRTADDEGVLAPDVEIVVERTGATKLLGEVRSQRLDRLVEQMLQGDDHTLAEMLARITAREADGSGTSTGVPGALATALEAAAVPVDGVVLADGSGLSRGTTATPAALTALLELVHDGGRAFDAVATGLPVAGDSGVLATRFGGDAAAAAGQVRAASGRTTGAESIAGLLTAADGTTFAFAFEATGDTLGDGTAAALDAVVAGVFRCGTNLAGT